MKAEHFCRRPLPQLHPLHLIPIICRTPRSMLPHPFSTSVSCSNENTSSSPFKPYDAGNKQKLLSRSDINLPPRIQPHPSAFFPPPPNPLVAHPFAPFAPHLPLHLHHVYQRHMVAAAANAGMNPLISRESNPAPHAPYKLPHGTILEMVRPHDAASAAAAAAAAVASANSALSHNGEQAPNSHGGISPTLSMSSRSSFEGGSGCGDANERSSGKRRKKSEDIPEWVKVSFESNCVNKLIKT